MAGRSHDPLCFVCQCHLSLRYSLVELHSAPLQGNCSRFFVLEHKEVLEIDNLGGGQLCRVSKRTLRKIIRLLTLPINADASEPEKLH